MGFNEFDSLLMDAWDLLDPGEGAEDREDVARSLVRLFLGYSLNEIQQPQGYIGQVWRALDAAPTESAS
jgi:hypothetical protein